MINDTKMQGYKLIGKIVQTQKSRKKDAEKESKKFIEKIRKNQKNTANAVYNNTIILQ